MKKVILASLLAATASSAIAAETTTLKVKGTLTTSACVPNLSNGGTVDFGNIALGGLSATEKNGLDARDIQLTITCDSPAKVAFTSVDDRKDSANITLVDAGDQYGFGLGKTAEGNNIGAYEVNVLTPTVDGAPGVLAYRNSGSTTFSDAAPGGVHLRNAVSLTRDFTASASGVPVAFTEAVFPLQVIPTIDATENLAITDDTELDGQTTISLVYL